MRSLSALYIFVFLPILFQYQGLIGRNGLQPLQHFVFGARPQDSFSLSSFFKFPHLFWFGQSDTYALLLALLGLVLAFLSLIGIMSGFQFFIMWLLQLSFVHGGQTFWSFGWETNLLEITFLALFIPPFFNLKRNPPLNSSLIMILLHRWVLFRLMLGAGLIKIRGDSCWTDLSCLNYHFETQPIPNPLSFLFHAAPSWFLKGGVILNHVVELILPFFIFGPRPLRLITGIIFVLFQASIALGGNFAWINYLTLVMTIPLFDDQFLQNCTPTFNKILKTKRVPLPTRKKLIHVLLGLLIFYLSIKPVKNLFSSRQVMNRSYDQFHIVNSYGVFGSITKKRFEIIIKGTNDDPRSPHARWQPYEFPCKPGAVDSMPCARSPYHYRITWQLWFAAMNSWQYNPWIVHLVYKLLKGRPEVLALTSQNPFPKAAPKFIKMDLYRYRLSSPRDDQWYERSFVKSYFPPVSLDHPQFVNLLKQMNYLN